MQNRRLRQATVFRNCRYENCEVLCKTCPKRLLRRPQNQTVRQEVIVRSGQHKNGGVPCTAHQTTMRCRRVQRERGWPTPLRKKKTIANILPSVAKHTSVRPPPTRTSQPSGASRDSRKRVRHPEVTSTASKRAVAREPTAGVVTVEWGPLP